MIGEKPTGTITSDVTRANISSAEVEPVMESSDREAIEVA